MDILELLIRAIIKAMSPPPPPRQRNAGLIDEQALIRRRIEVARQQQERDILVARMPTTVPRASQPANRTPPRVIAQPLFQPAKPSRNRQAAPPPYRPANRKQRPAAKSAQQAARAMPPPLPRRPSALDPSPAPAAMAKPVVAVHHSGLGPSRIWLSNSSLRSAIIASEILQPPLSLRESF
jgi:hypothetical protein